MVLQRRLLVVQNVTTIATKQEVQLDLVTRFQRREYRKGEIIILQWGKPG